MTWKNSTDSRTGWFRASLVRHFAAEPTRLFTILNDPESWEVATPKTRTSLERNEKIGYAFDNDSKADIRLVVANNRITRVEIDVYHLRDTAALEAATAYWESVLKQLSARVPADDVIAYQAPGKINLYFQVGPLRKDGYHEVASIYLAVDLLETLIAEPDSSWSVEVHGDLSQVHIDSVPTGEDNLVVKAAKAVAAKAKIEKPAPVHFTITKRVPVAGGMGGGSADAAAAIAAVNELWKAKLTAKQLESVAASIGADVPFALNGGLAVGTGTGDKIEVIESKGEYHWALVVDELGLSTPLVYGRVDELRSAPGQSPDKQPQPEVSQKLLKALSSGASPEKIAPLLHNDLQAAAITLRPGLRFILSLVDEVKALTAIVSGSGPTVAFLGRDREDAEAIAGRLRTRGLHVVVASAPAGGTVQVR